MDVAPRLSGPRPLAARAAAASVGRARRYRLSRAKHPSLGGHARPAKRFASLVPFYEYDGEEFFGADGAPDSIVRRRRDGFDRLAAASASSRVR